jgi:hypothetical protein
MKRVLGAALGILIATGAWAAEEAGHGGEHGARSPTGDYAAPPPLVDKRAFFTGNTLSAVAFIPLNPPRPALSGAGMSSLERVMFEAYLSEGGSAELRWYDPRTARYSAAQAQRWSLDGDRLCLGIPAPGAPSPMCWVVHVWGPNVNGFSTTAGGMLKGDVKPGNVLRRG